MTVTDKVRTATQSFHHNLDHALIPYIESISTKEDYAKLLVAFYGFFKPVYDCIDACIDVHCLPDYNSRRKPGYILENLEELGVSYSLQLCKKIPNINNNASAFGALYVLEGSTLGGLVIKKMITGKLHTEKGLSFFEGYGKQTRERWQIFIAEFNKLGGDTAQEQMVVDTASATFISFKEWLEAFYF